MASFNPAYWTHWAMKLNEEILSVEMCIFKKIEDFKTFKNIFINVYPKLLPTLTKLQSEFSNTGFLTLV